MKGRCAREIGRERRPAVVPQPKAGHFDARHFGQTAHDLSRYAAETRPQQRTVAEPQYPQIIQPRSANAWADS
jgi:hypothetical protein